MRTDDLRIGAIRALATPQLLTETLPADDLALEAAMGLVEHQPSESLVAAFALHGLGRHSEARIHFIRASLNYPFAMSLLLRKRTHKPKLFEHALDYDSGVSLRELLWAYLEGDDGRKALLFFRRLVRLPEVSEQLCNVEKTRAQLDIATNDGRSGPFQTLMRLQSMEFARELAEAVDRVQGRS